MPRSNCVVAIALLMSGGVISQQPDPDPALSKGLESYRSGDCTSATGQLDTSNVSRAGLALGRCYLEAGDFQKARTVLARYREAVPDDEDGIILLARSHSLDSKPDQAMSLLTTSQRNSPTALALETNWPDCTRRPIAKTRQSSVQLRA